MMTVGSCICPVARQTLQWMALAGTTVVLEQTALAEDTVSVLMKQWEADKARILEELTIVG